MTDAPLQVEVWRGEFLESVHLGDAVICDVRGDILHAWGDASKVILPRSSCKMLQALPLIESGAARTYGLRSEHLALACASHQGARLHTDLVADWLTELGLDDDALRCGPQETRDRDDLREMIAAGQEPCQMHNNCSGKHAGFLTVNAHIEGAPDYHDPLHPLQITVCEVFEEMTGESSPGFAIDGCSAPNFATSLKGLARAMACMAMEGNSARAKSAGQLVQAMMAHPMLVAGKGRACTDLMMAMDNVAVKTGAEGVFTAILPGKGVGVALKIRDGATRAADAAITAILVNLGVLDEAHPTAQSRMNGPILNRRGLVTGFVKVVI